jgi:hypothetical protein
MTTPRNDDDDMKTPPVSMRRPNLPPGRPQDPTPREGVAGAAASKADEDLDRVSDRFRLETSEDGANMHISCRDSDCEATWVFPMGTKPKDRAEARARIAPVAKELGAHADAHDAKRKGAS